MSQSFFVQRGACPGCGSRNYKELYCSSFVESPIRDYLESFYAPPGGVDLDYLAGADYILDECNDCSLIYQRLIPNSHLMTRLYEKWINAELSRRDEKHFEHYERLNREVVIVTRYFVKHFGLKPGQLEFLDFGMGWGDWCRMAQAYGCSVFGTELSQSRINNAKTFGILAIGWDEIAEHRFDFINTEQVFEHISDPLGTLGYLGQSLKPNGVIKISVPNGWDIKRRLAIMDWTASKGSKNSLNPVAPLEHINCFTRDSLVKMAQIAGFAPVQVSVQVKPSRDLLYLTIKDIVRPYYDQLVRIVFGRKPTSVFFQRQTR